MKTYPYNGQQIPGAEIEFEPETEPWTSYILHDGSKIKVRPIMTKIVRLEGVYNNNGEPVYTFEATNVCAVTAPEALCQKKEGN